MGVSEQIQELMRDFYARNPFVKLLGMKIEQVEEGSVRLSVPIDGKRHINAYRVAHGGVLMSAADTAMGASCLTVNKKVVTLEMNINCIKPVTEGATAWATGRILHNGRHTLVAECEITDAAGALYAKARGSFYVVGHLAE